MEQRRFLIFITLAMAIWLGWLNFVVPALFPEILKPRPPVVKQNLPEDSSQDEAAADALLPANVAIAKLDEPKPGSVTIPKHPIKSVLLGFEDPDPGKAEKLNDLSNDFFLAANLTSRGAAVDFVELTDKKQYPEFGHRGNRAKVLGADSLTPLKTFALSSPEIDGLLDGPSLDLVSWEIVPETDPATAKQAATFRFATPDGRWELTKRFEIHHLSDAERKKKDVKEQFAEGYELKLKVTVRNLSDQKQQLTYKLQGPVGIPLEDPENSYKHRDVRMAFLRDDGVTVDESKLSASEAVKKAKNETTQVWSRKLKYVGVDVLYFAALVFPDKDGVDSAKAIVANENRVKPEYSDISVELTSPLLKIPAKGEVSHEYTLFAGPKRKEMMGQLNAMAVMDYGWFDSICRGMVWLLNMFHHLGLSYGIAIICLTVLVRTLLIPISKHQAANAAKMKVLQPKLMAKQKELEAKYGKNTEEYMKAAQELSKEQLGMMMSGCLPMFLQLPIFIALYRAIGSSIELRMEPFLWFENLASPDALFKLPFIVPWFGWTHFNLLPCISTGLMYFHQKLTMPPPTNEEQAMQQKTMSYMMIFMGAMFFRVPSGLCLYFIATNVWSMTERWLFEHWKKNSPDESVQTAAAGTLVTTTGKGGATAVKTEEPKAPPFGGLWNKLQEAADNQRTASRQLENTNRDEKKKKKRS